MFSDFEEQAKNLLLDLGLELDGAFETGRWRRCQVISKNRRNADGSYKISSDGCYMVAKNWVSGESGYIVADKDANGKPLSKEERKKIAERSKRAIAQKEKERAELQGKIAQEAQNIWNKAREASPGQAYLQKKRLMPIQDMRQLDRDLKLLYHMDNEDKKHFQFAPKDSLVIPLRNERGQIRTLQFILPKCEKRFLREGETKGAFYPVSASKEKLAPKAGGRILIAEGIATAISLNAATGELTLAAMYADNLTPVAKIARKKYPRARIVICADYDESNEIFPNPGGCGVARASQAARAVNGALAICPLPDGATKADFDDLRLAGESARIDQTVRQAVEAEPLPALIEGFESNPYGKPDGLYRVDKEPNGKINLVRIGDNLEVMACTVELESKSEGLQLRWKSRATGEEQNEILQRRLLAGKNEDWLGPLLDRGWLPEPGCESHAYAYLLKANPFRVVDTASKTGWALNQTAYILPEQQICADPAKATLYTGPKLINKYQRAGSLRGWQGVIQLVGYNPNFEFALFCAFAGPLLPFIGADYGGFIFTGKSSCGKTTALHVSASVWGHPKGQIITFNSTVNGLEATAEAYNDNTMYVDELGTASREALRCIYQISEGAGRIRCGRDGNLKPNKTWRTLMLGTGEMNIVEKIRQEGGIAKTGQEIRLCEIPVSQDELQSHPEYSDQKLIATLMQGVTENYGHAGPAFIAKFVERMRQDANFIPDLREKMRKLAMDFMPTALGGSSQIARVAQAFALVAIAGELACEFDILSKYAFESRTTAYAAFDKWLKTQDDMESGEAKKAMSAVKFLLERHECCFQDIGDSTPVRDRLGYRFQDKDQKTVYLFLPEALQRELEKEGVTFKIAIEDLYEAGWLICNYTHEKGRYQYRKRLGGGRRGYFYAIKLPDEWQE